MSWQKVNKGSEQEPIEQEEVVPEEEKADIENGILTVKDIIKPDLKETQYIEKTQEEPVLKKLPPKPVIENKKTPEHAIKRIGYLITDPNLITRLSVVQDIDEKKEEGAQESDISPVANTGTQEGLKADGLVTKDGTLISAIKPDSIDKSILKKISNMLSSGETSPKKEGFRNRVSIEHPDKLLVALCIGNKYNLTIFAVPDVQFGIVLYQLNRTADKLEQILQ